MVNFIKDRHDTSTAREKFTKDSSKDSKNKLKRRVLSALALGAAGLALMSCSTAGSSEAPKDQPAATATQEATPNDESVPSPSAEARDKQAAIELDSSPESIRMHTVSYAEDMFTHFGSSEAPQAVDDPEFGGTVYSHDARAEKSADDYDCTTMIAVSAGSAGTASVTLNNKCADASGSLATSNMEFSTSDKDTVDRLSATTTSSDGQTHPAMSREELLDLMKDGAEGGGTLTPAATIVSSWGPGGKSVKTVRVEADGSVSSLDKPTSDQDEIETYVVGVFGDMRSKAFGEELSAEAPDESSAPQESTSGHENNETEKTLHEMRVEQLRSVDVMFEKYGPEKLEGGEVYIATAFGGGCTSRIGVNIMDGKASVNTSTVCDDERFSFTGRSEYSSSNPADIAELTQSMTPAELMETIKKLEHVRTETELRDKANSTSEKFEDNEDGLTHTYPSKVLGRQVTDRDEQVNPKDMLEHAASVSAAADAA